MAIAKTQGPINTKSTFKLYDEWLGKTMVDEDVDFVLANCSIGEMTQPGLEKMYMALWEKLYG